jgi:hypothetical protein
MSAFGPGKQKYRLLSAYRNAPTSQIHLRSHSVRGFPHAQDAGRSGLPVRSVNGRLREGTSPGEVGDEGSAPRLG